MKEESNHPKRVEDIFSDDVFSEQLLNGDIREEEFVEGEREFASNLLSAIGADKEMFCADQKALLDKRIIASIERSKRIKTRAWLSSAAILFVVIGLSLFLILHGRSDISDFASTVSVENNLNFTQLILPGKKIIRIETPESKIVYSKNGNEIKIDAQKEIESGENPIGSYNTIVVPYGKRSRVILSDNSVVWLNSGSKLIYPAIFAQEKREVFLDGEALFEVAPDKEHPFHVLTRSLEVKVLGTVFDLCAYSEDSTINTVLEHGSVELIGKKTLWSGRSTEKMVPGRLAIYNISDQTVVQKTVNPKDYTSWKDGYLVLEKKSLESIAKRLSRYYNVSIEFENPELGDEIFSGYLDLKNSAFQVLSMISEIMDVEVVQSDRVIRIRKKQSPV